MRRPLPTLLADQRGFTMTELLMVTTVLAVILGGVVLVQHQGQQAYLFGSHRIEAQQNGRAALELMSRELRSARSVTAVGGTTDLTFVDSTGATIRYQLAGTMLNRTVAGTTTPLIGGVQSLAMTCYSAWNGSTNTGTATTAPGAVKLVRLQLVTGTEDQVGPGSPADQHVAMESLVRLRNVP
ncbi:MAG TPA: prepilin-type N-terminal cleavage/methylation domain-containing protein [Methylomirabilota bacterium]|jgi:prepilin-type N-terminal cleavage/methylation domain-containing protein